MRAASASTVDEKSGRFKDDHCHGSLRIAGFGVTGSGGRANERDGENLAATVDHARWLLRERGQADMIAWLLDVPVNDVLRVMGWGVPEHVPNESRDEIGS